MCRESQETPPDVQVLSRASKEGLGQQGQAGGTCQGHPQTHQPQSRRSSELDTPRNSSQHWHTNTGQTKWALFWKINIDHIHLYISKHSIRNWTLPLSQALKYSGPEHRPLFSFGVGIPLPLLLLHTIWLPTLGQILHWFMASAVWGTDLQHKSRGQSTWAACTFLPTLSLLLSLPAEDGGFAPHTGSTSGIRAHQGNPASTETQHTCASTPWNALQQREGHAPALPAAEGPGTGGASGEWMLLSPLALPAPRGSRFGKLGKGTHWMTKQE